MALTTTVAIQALSHGVPGCQGNKKFSHPTCINAIAMAHVHSIYIGFKFRFYVQLCINISMQLQIDTTRSGCGQ